ncbi:UNVERIFIED_CONTAM: 8-hydroxygeraniol oxidoreductase [Sesamum angustifolium]|uniref:8-hydroxygeraniol oxidoreductase n=1 Tax=Sesamum angustifolium TaxID=2727405 RepID=A0AAW2KNV8_9LAMI
MSNTTAPAVISFKAAVIRKPGEPLQVEEIQVDPPKSSEVRIKMLCASMCHTDILCCNGFPAVSIHPHSQPPLTFNNIYKIMLSF